jgi:Flp pilus assembly pilin Flp
MVQNSAHTLSPCWSDTAGRNPVPAGCGNSSFRNNPVSNNPECCGYTTNFDLALSPDKGQDSIMTSLLVKAFARFIRDEQGQDLIEYTLLVAFITLASAGIFIDTGASMSGIWGDASTQLSTANAGS